jgi:DNA anti-recombination protein RmuC
VDERLSKLEFIIGLSNFDSDALLSGISPLTNKLNYANEQLTKLSDRVSKLSDNVRLIDATNDAQREEFSKWLLDLQKTQNHQAAIIKEHNDTLSKNLTVLESRIDKVQKMVEDLGEGMSAVRTKLTTHGHDDLKSVPDLVAKVGNLQRALDTMQSQIKYLNHVANRQPTGDMVQVKLADGKEYTFREYKSTRGLVKPYQSRNDLVLDDRWVDLAEPED